MKKVKLNNLLLLVTIFLFILIGVLIYTVVETYARYISENNGSDSASVASFVFDVNDKNSTNILSLNNVDHPGTSAVYSFVVTNKNSIVSEVSEQYTITLNIENCGLPIEVEINDKKIDMLVDGVLKSNGQISITNTFKAAIAEEHEYTIKITWQEDRNAITYAEKTADLILNFSAEQIN